MWSQTTMAWINTATLCSQSKRLNTKFQSARISKTSPWPSGLTPFPAQPAEPRASVKADWKVGTGAQSSSSSFSTEVTFLTAAETKGRTKSSRSVHLHIIHTLPNMGIIFSTVKNINKVFTSKSRPFHVLKPETKKLSGLWNRQNENRKETKTPGCPNTLVCLRIERSQFVGKEILISRFFLFQYDFHFSLG